jgi:hypothetical protein
VAPSSFGKNEAVSAKTLHFLCSHRGWPCSNGHLSSGLRAEFGIPIPKEIINQRILLINIDLFFWNTFFVWLTEHLHCPIAARFFPQLPWSPRGFGPGQDHKSWWRPTLCRKTSDSLWKIDQQLGFPEDKYRFSQSGIHYNWGIYREYMIYIYIIYYI